MKIKSIIGIALIILSIAGMVFWESYGREAVVSTEILTAARDIAIGETVSDGDIAVSSVDRSFVMPSALPSSDLHLLSGMRLASSVKEGQQLSMDHFTDAPVLIEDGESIFVLPESWIFTMSTDLAREDMCDIYLMPDESLIGSYVLAYRDGNVEIVCMPEEFFEIFEFMNREEASSLMIVPSAPEWRILQ